MAGNKFKSLDVLRTFYSEWIDDYESMIIRQYSVKYEINRQEG